MVSPKPWKFDETISGNDDKDIIRAANNEIIAHYIDYEDDAAHIVKCVNMHEALTEAIIMLIQCRNTHDDEWDEAVRRARKLLQEAQDEVGKIGFK